MCECVSKVMGTLASVGSVEREGKGKNERAKRVSVREGDGKESLQG